MGNLLPTMFMVLVQLTFSGNYILYKLAADDGTSMRILISYRFTIATAFTFLIAFVVEWRTRPKLTWRIVAQTFVCALLGGSLAQNLYAQSLLLTSATFVAAMNNLVPAMTFLLSVVLRLEKLQLSTKTGKAKVIGTVMSIGGAMLLTFYKGPPILWSVRVMDDHKHKAYQHRPVLGAILSISSCLSMALGFIMQDQMVNSLKSTYSSAALRNFAASVQSLIFALLTDRNRSHWDLRPDVSLLCIGYSGIVISGIMFTIICWCIERKGALFVSVFNPLALIIVAILGTFILGERLHVGSVLGAVMILAGLYAVLWGKRDITAQSMHTKRPNVEITHEDIERCDN